MISNKRIAFIMIFILISITILNAQINQGGVPESFSRTLRQNVPFVEMPEVDVQAMLDEDEYNIQFKDVPWRFGKNNYVDLTLTNSGVWEELPNGDKIWRLGISSPGAYTINLTFDNYYLPENSRLFVYNEDHTHIIGAFTDFNNREDHVFATTLVQGDKITIEYFEPAKVEFRGELSLEMVTHGYRDAYGYARAFGSSGSCNNNVACPEGDPWVDEIKSAVMLVSGGSGFCSGALINNTSEDGTPYLLTADHCYSDPSSWVFWFNWQSSTCANPGSSPAYDSMSGATLRARNSDSDFCLVELGSTPPAGYNVFYSGWNRQDAASTSSVGIHHPSGDIKKISFDYDPCVTSDYDPSPYLADSHWEITQWDDGTTEGGSSGSPLFDQNHRIIGQLHGGWASCTSLTEDFYGKFSMSWDRGGSSSNQLEDWLDPTGIAGLTLDGYDPNSTTYPPVANFSADDTTPAVGQTVNFTDLSTNNPDTWSWSFNPTSITYVGGTSSTSENPQVQFNSTGQYTVTLYAENAYGNDTEIKTNYITAVDCTVTSFPWSEGFENGGAIPDCWSQEYVVDTQDWEYQNGGHSSNPASAHGGSYNAYLYNASTTANVTHLITPPMDLSGFTSASLTFWHTQAYWSPDQDELRVYYKTSAAGSWNLLATYTSSITSWTEETLSLSGMSSDYYIGFEGTAQYGHGVCLDDIEIDGTASSPEITVTSPNGGEDWELDTTHNITWASSNTSGDVKIELYDNGVFYNTIIASTTDDGTYGWNIPAAYDAGTQYTVKIEDVTDPGTYDDSNADFTLSDPPAITVTSPNGGENWLLDSTHNITWTSVNTSGDVKIELYDNGVFYNTIIASTTDDGTYSWNIPAAYDAGTQYTVKIEDASASSVYDYSDADFTLSEVLPVIDVSVTTLSSTLAPDEIDAAQSFDISNIGDAGSNLTYDITWEYTTARISSDRPPVNPSLDRGVPHPVYAQIYTYSLNEDWLDLDPITGDCNYGETDVIDVEFNSAGLSAGTYTAVISISNNAGADETIDVTLNVTASRDPYPASITFNAWILGREGEVLTESSFGCGYWNTEGWLWVECGNFPTDWTNGDVLHIEAYEPATGHTATGEIILNWEAYQYMDDMHLAPEFPPDTPLNVIISEDGTNVILNWDAVTGATSYTVYSDTDPYGGFTNVEQSGITGTTWSELLTGAGDMKFYQVTASN